MVETYLAESELKVLQLEAQQKNDMEISGILNISKNTVERHRKKHDR